MCGTGLSGSRSLAASSRATSSVAAVRRRARRRPAGAPARSIAATRRRARVKAASARAGCVRVHVGAAESGPGIGIARRQAAAAQQRRPWHPRRARFDQQSAESEQRRHAVRVQRQHGAIGVHRRRALAMRAQAVGEPRQRFVPVRQTRPPAAASDPVRARFRPRGRDRSRGSTGSRATGPRRRATPRVDAVRHRRADVPAPRSVRRPDRPPHTARFRDPTPGSESPDASAVARDIARRMGVAAQPSESPVAVAGNGAVVIGQQFLDARR